MGTRFVRPETVTLQISEGDTLTVKKRLTSGEQRAAHARLYHANGDNGLKLNPLALGLAVVSAYLIDWSLTDANGIKVEIRNQPIEILEGAINDLEPESFDEIRQAIEDHERAQAAARAEEKKLRAGARLSPSISGSPAVVVGGTNG